MYTIRYTPEFSHWFASLRDRTVKQRLSARLRKVSLGNFGDVKSVGEGVSELQEHLGAGWRMYFVQRGQVLVVMLGGGSKATQAADIAKAKEVAASLNEENEA
ncbi:MAG: type II toxin-antitoxin system RelE/ParE family toxin [Zoogloeaceae bacterium]|jgi:putative addiction module killer protein|nr:type II toxin-antitoxin system RelE/ParE family toxin [Zoogloeaceae bacterium]